jgi:DNA-binding transcriptional ArsR family regulator
MNIEMLSNFFKALGDPTRLRIMELLFESELCVCDIAEKMKMNQPAISQQLKVLKQANLIKVRRDGRHLFYSLSDDHVRLIFDQSLIHIEHTNQSSKGFQPLDRK